MSDKNNPELDHCTVYWPRILTPLIKQRMAEEHYKSAGKFFEGLLAFDLSTRCRHWLTSQLISEPKEIRLKVYEEIVREFPNMPRGDGGWFRARVKEIIAEHRGNPLKE